MGGPARAQAKRNFFLPDPYVLIVGPEGETRRRLADILARAPYEIGRCRWDQLAADLQSRSPDLLVLIEEAGRNAAVHSQTQGRRRLLEPAHYRGPG